MSYMELILTIVGGLVAADILLDLWLAYNLLQYRRERAHPGTRNLGGQIDGP